MPEGWHGRLVRFSIESRRDDADGGASGFRLWTDYFLTEDCGGMWDRRRLTIEGA
jgi:hypothetical protein